MPIIRVTLWDKTAKKRIWRTYNTDTAIFVCQVPGGRLLKKKNKCNFYIYNPKAKSKKEQVTEVTYNEAKELIRVHGTREQFCRYFSVLNADGSYKSGGKNYVTLDEFHAVKLFRTASFLGMTPSQAVSYLIDRYDDNRNYNGSCVTQRSNGRTTPVSLSEFTS